MSSITPSSASVNFASTGNNFIVEYGLTGFTPGTGSVAGGGTIATATGSPVVLNSLTEGAAYDVYVRQVCTGVEYSSNSSVVQFTTGLSAVNTPYVENFDGVAAPTVPPSVSVQNVNGGKTWRTVGTDYYVSAPNCMRLDYEENGVTPSNDWFFTRGLNLAAGNSYRLTFQYRNSDHILWTEKLEVKYGLAPNAAAMTSGTLFSNTNIDYQLWREGGVDFTPAVSGIYYIGFHGFSDANKAFVAIDDIKVDGTPACPPPIGVFLSNITASTATVNFTGSGAGYVVEYGLQGFTPGTGSSAGIGGTVVSAAGSPVIIIGLATLVSYDVYVRQVCIGPVYGANSTAVPLQTTIVNDNAPGAISVIVGAGCSGEIYTNTGATQSDGEPFGSCSGSSGYATVWYKFIAPASGAVRISTANGPGANTLTNSRLALFSATDVNSYSTFSIISCDEDGGSGTFDQMSVAYATGLTPGIEYYIQVDAFDNLTSRGTFCLTVDELNASMLATTASCTTGQTPVGSIATYNGWVSLMDNDSRLIALVRNPTGASVNSYSVSQTIHISDPRVDATSGEYYLNRNYHLNNTAGVANVDVQLFFLAEDLTNFQSANQGTLLNALRITRQTGSCQESFVATNGSNFEHIQNGNGSSGGVNWVRFSTSELSNFYIHSTRAELVVKVFLQGAYNSTLGRHKNVTTAWANVMNTNALNQPFNTSAFGNYAGSEGVPNGFFSSNGTSTTDIIDWVLVELKDASNALISRRAGFVREDGQIVDIDGISPLVFNGVTTNNYYITIRHRNHLGISTQSLTTISTKALGTAPSSTLNFDFTTAIDANIFGTAAAYRIVGPNNVMICGNANGNANVRFGGLSNDVSTILVFLGSTTAVINNVYSSNDINMDGTVRFGGLNNDVGFLQNNALGGSTTLVVNEQKR